MDGQCNSIYGAQFKSEPSCDSGPSENERGPRLLDVRKIPNEFMTYCNCMIRDCSDQTAVTFMHLPSPPAAGRDGDEQVKYLRLLSELTKGLPPTVMVHGIHAVTSTAL